MPGRYYDRPMPHAFSRPTEYVDRVLDVVEAIPPGNVMSYGDIAEYLGEGGPRQVGAVMSAWGGGVCWWRVVRADGSPPQGHEVEALSHYAAEATPTRPGGDRVDMSRARWDGSAPPRHTGLPEDL
ncbi:hypothetical protein GCM10009834_20300 [Streptomonospora arabica]